MERLPWRHQLKANQRRGGVQRTCPDTALLLLAANSLPVRGQASVQRVFWAEAMVKPRARLLSSREANHGSGCSKKTALISVGGFEARV